MANYAIQLRRGTSAEHSSFTGLVGEITVNTSNSSIHVHDGSTAGGTELATKASVDNLSSDTLIDADSDTYVKVETSADADTVQINTGGSTRGLFSSSGLDVTGDMIASNNIKGYEVYGTNQNARLFLGDSSQAGGTTEVYMNTTSGGTWHMITSNSSGWFFKDNVNGDSITFKTKTSGGSDSTPLILNGDGDATVGRNLIVTGDLTVSGTTTTVNTETINLADNTIMLNSNATGSATEDAGIEIERGDDTNVSFLWDETNDRWTFADKNVFTSGEFQGTATSAQYADLAERYHSGSPIEAGSVVCFGGDNEIEMCNEAGSTRVAGVISTAPAYMMNRDAGDDSTHPYVALAGRVPCKVTGSIRKGDLLHSSAMAGHAEAGEFKGGAMIGKALENFDGESGVIEVLVNLM